MRSAGSCTVLALLLASCAGSAPVREEESPAKRLAALETESEDLAEKVRALRADVPQDQESTRAEIAARVEREVGEAPADEKVGRAAAQVASDRERAVTAAVRRCVDEMKREPLRHDLAAPVVMLQVRSGAGGGNPNTVDMAGVTSQYVDLRSRRPIPWSPSVDMHEDSRAFVEGGTVPGGRTFVVTHVSWRGVATGDSNGHGEFVVRVGGQTLAQRRDDPAVTEGSWTGRVVIPRGKESTVNAEVANSSHVEVRIEGEFVDAAAGAR
jgi:cytochrome c556